MNTVMSNDINPAHIVAADGKDLDKVELRDDGNIGRETPHCVDHGAMNKTYSFEEGGGFWNCTAITERGSGTREITETCDAGCKHEVREIPME